jgi:hypothetical protein
MRISASPSSSLENSAASTRRLLLTTANFAGDQCDALHVAACHQVAGDIDGMRLRHDGAQVFVDRVLVERVDYCDFSAATGLLDLGGCCLEAVPGAAGQETQAPSLANVLATPRPIEPPAP